jgi:hypothetical protein
MKLMLQHDLWVSLGPSALSNMEIDFCYSWLLMHSTSIANYQQPKCCRPSTCSTGVRGSISSPAADTSRPAAPIGERCPAAAEESLEEEVSQDELCRHFSLHPVPGFFFKRKGLLNGSVAKALPVSLRLTLRGFLVQSRADAYLHQGTSTLYRLLSRHADLHCNP